MSKKVVAIVSVLKPVSDPRNYEKIANSIGNTNKYEINIIGFWAKNLEERPNIIFHPILHFNRISLARAMAPWKILKICIKLKPELIIVTCTELLPVMVLYKILFGTKIIYDIQENYFRNILYTNTYPTLIRWPLAGLSRLAEYLLAPLIDRFILAEKVYASQLKFIGSRFEIFENTAVIPENLLHTPAPKKNGKVFLYCGTISEHYGIEDAIDLICRLHSQNPNVQLRIAGYSPDGKFFRSLVQKIKRYDFIQLIGGDVFVPHNEILNEMISADFCLLPYRRNKATEGRIPTKLFECLALEIPVIITPNPAWNHLITENNAGLIYDFTNKLPGLPDWNKHHFYDRDTKKNYVWENDSSRFQIMIDDLFIRT